MMSITGIVRSEAERSKSSSFGIDALYVNVRYNQELNIAGRNNKNEFRELHEVFNIVQSNVLLMNNIQKNIPYQIQL